jgi:Zn-dependent protease
MEILLISLPILIFSVVVHEYAHGWMAHREGDPTALMLGRLTLNPIPHIDPVGSLLVPGLLALSGSGALLGWARPVPVNPRNFREFKRGDILVSLAGVAANFILAILFTLLSVVAIWGMRLLPDLGATWMVIAQMSSYGIRINFLLMIFNLLPIPPLDGSHVFAYLLPPRLAVRYRQIGMGGMVVLFALLFLGGFRFLMWPLNFFVGWSIALRNLLT